MPWAAWTKAQQLPKETKPKLNQKKEEKAKNPSATRSNINFGRDPGHT